MQKNDLKPHLIIAVVSLLTLAIALILSGCDLAPADVTPSPTFTATQTEIPTPTIDWFPATPTPTLLSLPSSTPQPTLADLRTGITELLVEDDFTNERMWETRLSPDGNITLGVENLTLAIARPNTSLISLSQHNLAEDFYLEVTLQTTLCQPLDQIGILFWIQTESDYYRLLVDCAGQARLEVVQGGQPIGLQDWESLRRAQPGAPASNRLGLWVSRGNFQLYINDVYQFEQRIALNRSGRLGLFARTINGNAMTVRFADLQIYQVETE